jgi:cytochrome bd-type quinol oxidase subunit 1
LIRLTAGVIVSMSGLAAAVFVTIANAWMNTPRGFELVNGHDYYRTGENHELRPEKTQFK